MEQKRPSTPEKQLLNLIEGSEKSRLSRKEIKHRGLNLLSIAALRGRVSFVREKIKGFSFDKSFLDIKGLVVIFQICIMVLSLYLGIDFFISIRNSGKLPTFDVEAASANSLKAIEQGDSFKKLSYYLERPRSRNIFSFHSLTLIEPEEEVPEPQEIAAIPKIDEILMDFKLVGIGWSDDPDVMVEDTSSGEVYFLKRGEWIEDKLKVEAIFQNKIILSHEGDERELR